jgi:myo-inositol 2-dehydrogenase/D-chiro-inositol 1-dehydrogenase
MSSNSDRRDFLKSAGAAAGVAAAAGLSGAYAAAGNDNIKVGVIGCGGRGNGAIRNILDADDKVEIVAFGDVFEGQAKGSFNNWKNNKQHGARIKATPDTVFSGLDAYKKVLAADIDLVILATPPGFRPFHLEAAVNSSKKIHIFCEKPVAVDAAGIRKCLSLVEASKAKGIGLVAGTQRRHQKGYIETIGKLKDGAIGDVVSARCAWNSGGSPPIWFHDRRPGEPDATYQIRNWYHFMWVCGDHIVEQHVHNLDVINWVMGSHPIRATGMGGRATRKIGDPNEVGNIFDHFAVEYEYKNGV